MGIYDEIRNILAPHANSLNKTIAVTGMAISNKLDLIEKKASDAFKPDVGDKWIRFNIKKEFAGAETEELGEVPQNEIWKVHALVVDGIQEKSPAFIITGSSSVLFFSVIKEGVGTETVGGDLVLLKGERLAITTRGSGKISATLHLIRMKVPTVPFHDVTGEPEGALEPINTHDPKRDVIMSETGQYTETQPETLEVGT